MESAAFNVISFRVPAVMVDVLLGPDDQQALYIAFRTKTELELPRRFQSTTFIVSGYQNNVYRALRMVEEIINEKFGDSESPAYAFIPDPNREQSRADYILCNGPIHEAKYRPGREGMQRG